MNIAALHQAVAAGQTSHEAIIGQALEKARSVQAHAVFTHLYADTALAAAREADRRRQRGETLPPLAGLPVSVKDLFDVAGESTEGGSAVYADALPAVGDALAVQRLRSAGAAIVGKTNMSELAFTGVGLNPRHGTPVNPSDAVVPRIPGGSSSGAAVSVALGIAVAGLGSDTGGSIRIPAALCGLVGFKSTQSRVPRVGAMPLSQSLDTVCAMSRSVADCVTVDAVIADAPLDVKPVSLKGVRMLVPQTRVLDDLQPAVATAFDDVLNRLRAAGVVLIEKAVPEFEEVMRLNQPASFAAIEGHAVHRLHLTTDRHRFDPRVARRLETGAGVSAADYLDLIKYRQHWISRLERRLQTFAAWICPTVPVVAAPIAEVDASDASFFAMNALLLRNPSIVNLHDGCSFSIPCQRSGEAPVGLMLSTRAGGDAALAAVAAQVADLLA